MSERAPASETATLPRLVAEKLAAFGRLEPDFEASFQYVQEMQGYWRFPALPAQATVRYLHALWICDCKDRLLGVPRTIERYEAHRCLELLARSQEGAERAELVAFLQHRLDTLDFAAITRQLEAARRAGQEAIEQRLVHGRLVLLNRGMNLLRALEPLFTLSEQALLDEVRAACAQLGHTPAQIEQQLRDMETPLYAFVRHPTLAQRNMLVMDRLIRRMADNASDRPGGRTWRVAAPTMPDAPYAQQVIAGYVALTAPQHNNPRGVRFADRPELVIPMPHEEPLTDVDA
jgi:hypothetical protein